METVVKGIEGVLEAAEIIRQGGLVAFPTETVYGLGANALDPAAADRIYAAKGRPSDNPLIVHIASEQDVEPLVSSFPDTAARLMRRFWPGPLTIVLFKSAKVPLRTTGGLQTVALRCPEHKMALRLIEESGVPIAAPSANLSGRPSPTEAAHVLEDLDGRIDFILDDGPVGIGVESTIVDLTGESPVLLRPGAVTKEELEEVLGREVEIDPAILQGDMEEGAQPKAPGMKYKHYAPKAQMSLVTARVMKEKDYLLNAAEQAEADEEVADSINKEAEISIKAGNRVGILCCEETKGRYRTGYGNIKVRIKVLGSRKDPPSMLRNLYRLLREFDAEAVDEIFSESYSERGLFFPLMNRLRKAAGMREMIV